MAALMQCHLLVELGHDFKKTFKLAQYTQIMKQGAKTHNSTYIKVAIHQAVECMC